MKVDSRCFNLSQQIDQFLSLGNASRTNLTPPGFWKELVQSEDAVSSYIVCLIAKLISLDSDHGLRPLPHVYKDLVEMPVDHSKYKQWSAKPLPTNCKSAAVELQYAIITTIRHLKDCYGYSPSIHLRHMYLRWNLARNYSSNGDKKADEYEEKVISPFSVAQAKEVILSPVGSPTHKAASPPLSQGFPTPEDEELVLVRRLVDECYTNHRRAFFGALPPEQCKLCSYTNATDCLSYVRLRDLTSRSPRLLGVAMEHVLTILGGEAVHGQSYSEREVLFPLLHLFREFLAMMCPVDTVEVYRAIMPFYMWPLSHSDYTRGVLDQIMQEGRVRGATFRKRIFAEQDVGLKPSETKTRGHLVHMLVDTSHPLTRGGLLHDLLTTQQERSNQHTMQRLIIRNVCRALDTEFDVVDFERKLQHLSLDSLKGFCLRALEVVERGSHEGSTRILKAEAETLRKEVVQLVECEEQRDSAVSCSSVDSDTHFTEEHLNSFPLPAPFMHSHALNDTQYPTVLSKMREVLIACRQAMSNAALPPSGEKPPLRTVDIVLTRQKKQLASVSSSSQTSLDSTGSSTVEPVVQVEGTSVDSDTDSKKSVNGILANGHAHPVTNGDAEQTGGVTNGHDNRVANGFSNNSDHTGLDSPDSPGQVIKKRPTSLHGIQDDVLSTNSKNAESSVPSSLDTPKSCDRVSLTSEDSTKDISPATRRRQAGESPRSQLVRRQTCPSGMFAKRTSILNSAQSPSNSRRYAKVSVTKMAGPRPTSGSLSLTNRVKIRRNPSAANRSMKRRTNSHTSLIPSGSAAKLVKVMLAGNDELVSHAAKAYAHLKMDEPNLLSGMELQFYYVPLSRASLIHTQFPELAQASIGGGSSSGGGQGSGDLPEPMFEQVDLSGNDVHIGRFLAHLDSWYERNVMMAIHHLLRLVPCDLPSNTPIPSIPGVTPRPMSPVALTTTATLGEATLASRTNLTPSKVLLEALSNYSREANNSVNVNMYKLKLNIKNEKSHKMDYRETYMLHRLDIQRLSGKKTANRQVKTFEANVTMTQLGLDGGLIRSDLMELKDVWIIRASNVPRAGDSCVPNPESDCFEMTIIKAVSEGRFGATKFRPGEETQHHVCDLVVETRDKPFTVMVDSNSDVLLENVIRLEILPAFVEQNSTRGNDQKTEKRLHFPLMTYWPVDL